MQKKFIAIAAFFVLVAFGGGFVAGGFCSSEIEIVEVPVKEIVSNILENSKVSENLDIRTFDKVWEVAEKKFVDVERLNPEEMLYGAMKGVIASLGDPHSEFLTPAESEEFLDSLEGHLTGIGAEVGMRDEILTIISPLRGSPAEKAGLLPGDKIFKIDDEIASDYSLFEAVKRIRGEIGTEVILTIFRGEEMQSREIKIIRDFIEI